MNINKDETLILKGMAILLVILTHFPRVGFFNHNFSGLGGWGVSIFLFLSGYGLWLSYQKNGRKNYWYKRLKSVYIPFYIAMLIQTLIYILLFHKSFDQKILLLSFLGIYPDNVIDGSMWYISYLTIWYVFFGFITLLPAKNKGIKIMMLLPIMLVVQIIAKNQLFANGLASMYILFFPLGIFCAYFKDKIIPRHNAVQYTALILLIILISLWIFHGVNHMNWWPVYFILVIIFFVSAIKLLPNVFIKPLKFIGRHSYSMYLYEYLCFNLINVFPKINMQVLNEFTLLVYFIILLSFFVFISERIIEFLENLLSKERE